MKLVVHVMITEFIGLVCLSEGFCNIRYWSLKQRVK